MSSEKQVKNMVKAQEISPIWKHSFFESSKRILIKDTIVYIYNQLPADSKYDTLRQYFGSILDSLWYAAPEVLNNSWNHIYKCLSTSIPFHNDKTKDPQWTQNINAVWLEGNKKMNDLDKTSQ